MLKYLGARLAAALVSGTVALAAAEVGVRLIVPDYTFWPIVDIYRPVSTPGVIYTLRPQLNQTAFGVDLVANSLGFRGPEWSQQKPPDVTRIAVLGDSHAFGYGVAFEQTTGQRTAALLDAAMDSRHEVLNFALAGYTSRQALAIFDAFVVDFEPDLVVVLATENDHEAGLVVDPKGYLMLPPSDTSGGSESVFYRAKRYLHGFLMKSRLYVFLRRTMVETLQYREPPDDSALAAGTDVRPPVPIPPELVDTVMSPLTELITKARQNQIPVVIASLESTPAYRSLFRRLSTQQRTPLLELLSLFPEARNLDALRATSSLGWDSHFAEDVHERWAEGLVELILNERLLPNQTTTE